MNQYSIFLIYINIIIKTTIDRKYSSDLVICRFEIRLVFCYYSIVNNTNWVNAECIHTGSDVSPIKMYVLERYEKVRLCFCEIQFWKKMKLSSYWMYNCYATSQPSSRSSMHINLNIWGVIIYHRNYRLFGKFFYGRPEEPFQEILGNCTDFSLH